MPKFTVAIYVELEAKDADQAAEFANNILEEVEFHNNGDDRSVWMGDVELS